MSPRDRKPYECWCGFQGTRFRVPHRKYHLCVKCTHLPNEHQPRCACGCQKFRVGDPSASGSVYATPTAVESNRRKH